MCERAKAHHISLFTQHAGSFFGFYFTDTQKIESLFDVQQCNIELFKKFFHHALAEGIYFAPSAYEAGFLSSAHQEQEIQLTLNAVEKVFEKLTKMY